MDKGTIALLQPAREVSVGEQMTDSKSRIRFTQYMSQKIKRYEINIGGDM